MDKFLKDLKELASKIEEEDLMYPRSYANPRLTKDQYYKEILKVWRAKEFRKNRFPKELFHFGWEIAKGKSQYWIVQRVIFWLYAYNKHHVWTEKDFLYEINDAAYEKAKLKREERKKHNRKLATEIHNRPRPLPEPETSWDECSGPPMELLKGLFDDKG